MKRNGSTDRVEVLSCSPSLDADAMVGVKDKMNRLVSRNQKKIVLDMRETSSVDLAGLSILVERLRALRSMNGNVKFCNLKPEVYQVIQMVGLGSILDLYPSREEALASF
jgi:anti-anti-sigma factor